MIPFERLFKFMTSPWVVMIFIMLLLGCYFYLDQILALQLSYLHLSNTFPYLNWFTALGKGAPYFFLFFAAGIFFRYVKSSPLWETRCWFLLSCVIFSNVICGILKVLLGRARPGMWLQQQYYGFYGWHRQEQFMSFPSGHTSTIMSVVFGLSILFPRYWAAFLSTGLLVALSRVLLVQHYLSDILVASYLALLEVGLLYYLLRKKSWMQRILTPSASPYLSCSY